MARLSHGPAALAPGGRAADPLTDLTRLLGRLQQTVLRADAERERRLRASEYERRRVDTNINHARTLLTRLEQEALAVKVHSRRQDLLTDLNRKREVIDQLTERMGDLEEIANVAGYDDDDDTSDGEDILGEIIATPSESMDSRSTSGVALEGGGGDAEEGSEPVPDLQEEEPPRKLKPTPEPHPEEQKAAIEEKGPKISEKTETATSQTVRSRGKPPTTTTAPEEKDAEARATGSSLLGGRTAAPSQTTTTATTTTTTKSVTATTEAILDHQRAEQDLLSESILRMAGDLKTSSQAFSRSLEEDRDALGLAGESLDRSGRGLEAAARRLGALRRITEGKGWWGRMLLYAWVYGLMVVLLVVVFVLPKLRF